jgi:hypothetical protein
MIRNRNLIFGKANGSSPDSDKYLVVPKIATADRPTASTTFEGAIYWDTTANVLKVNENGTWKTISTASE